MVTNSPHAPNAARRKAFGVGFHKTGTTSLAQALQILGYRVTGPNGTGRPDIAEAAWSICEGLIPRYDGFADNPWPLFYERLDDRCPGSCFILTTRPSDEWITSVVGHFGVTESPMRRWIYGAGAPRGHEDRYIEVYERHNRAVRDHFAGRPGDFLELDLASRPGWDELCRLVGCDRPAVAFPHANPAAGLSRRTRRARVAGRHLLDRVVGRAGRS